MLGSTALKDTQGLVSIDSFHTRLCVIHYTLTTSSSSSCQLCRLVVLDLLDISMVGHVSKNPLIVLSIVYLSRCPMPEGKKS